jgi:hypothetical protein
MYENCEDFDYEPAYQQNEDDLLAWEEEQVFQDGVAEREEKEFWCCDFCGAQNHVMDGSCQWCDEDDEGEPGDGVIQEGLTEYARSRHRRIIEDEDEFKPSHARWANRSDFEHDDSE